MRGFTKCLPCCETLDQCVELSQAQENGHRVTVKPMMCALISSHKKTQINEIRPARKKKLHKEMTRWHGFSPSPGLYRTQVFHATLRNATGKNCLSKGGYRRARDRPRQNTTSPMISSARRPRSVQCRRTVSAHGLITFCRCSDVPDDRSICFLVLPEAGVIFTSRTKSSICTLSAKKQFFHCSAVQKCHGDVALTQVFRVT